MSMAEAVVLWLCAGGHGELIGKGVIACRLGGQTSKEGGIA